MNIAECEFGFVASAAGEPGVSDKQCYIDLLGDCEWASDIGYTTAWVIEHHFSDYFPTPDPIGLLQHIAGHFPALNLGTCVIVTPWHEPLRLAGSIAQLNNLTEAELHLGVGRGTAKYEYDAFGIDMASTRQRFAETMNIIRLGLVGDSFSFKGELNNIEMPLKLRPRTDNSKIHFYGAIGGSPSSAEVMADLGLPPICTSVGNFELQRAALDAWRARAAPDIVRASTTFPIMINCIVADSDKEAVEQAQRYIPRFMQAQVDHYTVDATDWDNIPSYESWARIFSGMKARCDPANIPPWTEWQLIGSVDTVRSRLQAYIDCGFNNFLIHTATPGVPAHIRREWSGRFMREVVAPLRNSAPANLGAARLSMGKSR